VSTGTGIEWTEATWNPLAGCTPVSPGCLNCYAATMSHRLACMGQAKYAGLTVERGQGQDRRKVFTGKLSFDEGALLAPLAWRKPRRVFVNSMSDLFHEEVPFEFVDRVWAVMASSSRHTFQVLTKRPERMAEYLVRVTQRGGPALDRYVDELRRYHEQHLEGYREGYTLPSPPTPELRFIYDSACEQEKHRFTYDRSTKPLGHGFSGGEFHWRPWPLSNVWLGTSVEDQERADQRVPQLLRCPAAVRFLSCEPLLGPLDLRLAFEEGLTELCPTHWVIVGGESGGKSRPCNVAWVRSVVEQCRAAGVPCFVKQLGGNCHAENGGDYRKVVRTQEGIVAASVESLDPAWVGVSEAEAGCGRPIIRSDGRVCLADRKGGDVAEWPEHLRVREFPAGVPA
jgi:protein gp37